MSESIWKHGSVWWAPIILMLLGGVGWLIKTNVEMSRQLATLVGKVPPPPGRVSIYLNSEKIAETSDTGWFRVDGIPPGEHEIRWELDGYGVNYTNVEVEGGRQNRVNLPPLKARTHENLAPVFTENEMITESNTWYAGVRYMGEIDMYPQFPFVWQCSGGTCTMHGPYGDGLNMEVCQLLVSYVGPLEYYYNDSGMIWNKTENTALLAQCNQGPKPVDSLDWNTTE